MVAKETPQIVGDPIKSPLAAGSAGMTVGLLALAAAVILWPILFHWQPILWCSMLMVWLLCTIMGANGPGSGCGDAVLFLLPIGAGLYLLTAVVLATTAISALLSYVRAARSRHRKPVA